MTTIATSLRPLAVPIGSLTHLAGNPRKGDVAAVARSLAAFGQRKPVVARRDGTVIAGNHTLDGALSLGWAEIAVVYVDDDDATAKAYALADNRTSDLGVYDPDALLAMIEEVRDADAALLEAASYSGADLLAQIALDREEAAAETGNGDASVLDGRSHPGALRERFVMPPFSLLDQRAGYWQERRRAWLSLGIKSEVGRDEELAFPFGHREPGTLGHLMKTMAASNTSVFDPVVCELAYRWFCPPGGVVLDPFAGGSVRGVVAAALGRTYVGVELRAEQVAANEQQWADIAPLLRLEEASAPTWARGYPLAALQAIAGVFAEHDAGLVLGAYSGVNEAAVAGWLEADALRFVTVGGLPVAAAVLGFAKGARAIADYSGRDVATVAPQTVHVKRIAARRGHEGDLANMLAALLEGHEAVVECWQEHPADRAVVAGLGLAHQGTKIKASSEMVGVYARSAATSSSEADAGSLRRLRLEVPDPLRLAALDAIAREELAFADHYSHYNLRRSWSALALRGFGDDPTQIEKPAEMSRKWRADHPGSEAWPLTDTSLRARLPELEALIALVPGEKQRIRLMRLAPGNGELTRHADITDPEAGTGDDRLLRVHVPLVTNKGVRFASWDDQGARLEAHMAVGEAWYLDTRKPHTARNDGPNPRLHLVMDVYSSPALLALLEPPGAAVPVVPLADLPDTLDAEMRSTLPKEVGAAPAKPMWVEGDARERIEPTGSCDLVFTCPPYYDLETYSDDPRDLSCAATYDDFLDGYRVILAAALASLREDRFAVVVIGDVRGPGSGSYRGLVADTITIMRDLGAPLYNEAILLQPLTSLPLRAGYYFTVSRKLGRGHQSVLVFCKGDPRAAADACGPVDVTLPPGMVEEGDEDVDLEGEENEG